MHVVIPDSWTKAINVFERDSEGVSLQHSFTLRMYSYGTQRKELRQMTYHSVQDWSCLHLPSYMSSVVVRRVFILR
jgi:hypothetical protein